MTLIFQIFLYAAAIYTADALCNACSAINGVACVASDQFQVCSNGIPVPPVVPCPSGWICSATGAVCSPAGSVPPSCDRCGECSSNKVFACITYNTFAACSGGDTPDTSSIFSCPGTTACNVDSEFVCVDPAITGIGGTCPSVTTTSSSTTSSTTTSSSTTSSSTTSTSTTPSSTTSSSTTTSSTTPNPATSPQAYCASVGTSGRFDIPTDSTCKSYILCALVNNTWIGQIYQCPGVTLFNATSKLCGVARPARCP